MTCTFQTQWLSCAWLGELKVQLGHPIKVCGGDEQVLDIVKQMNGCNTRKAKWIGIGWVIKEEKWQEDDV